MNRLIDICSKIKACNRYHAYVDYNMYKTTKLLIICKQIYFVCKHFKK